MTYTKQDLVKAKTLLRQMGDSSRTELEKAIAGLLYKERESVTGQFEYVWKQFISPALCGGPEGLVNTLRIELSKTRRPKLTVKEVGKE